jgi:DNA-directed RNA polymerase subunit RPC12/RpoP
MKYLKCIICDGEVDILDDDHSIVKQIKCKKCGFSICIEEKQKTEIIIIHKRSPI